MELGQLCQLFFDVSVGLEKRSRLQVRLDAYDFNVVRRNRLSWEIMGLMRPIGPMRLMGLSQTAFLHSPIRRGRRRPRYGAKLRFRIHP